MFGKKFLYGAAYYPEHWDPKRWPTDVKMMKEAGFNVVRMGEFAWCNFEPREGTFDFDWLDSAIDLLASAGIAAIVGTPTATIPAWMAQKYPHVMAIDEKGHRKPFGVRKDYCVNQPDFDRLSMRIVEQVARHYAKDKRVIGFQTDNEFGSSPCRCETCLQHFHAALKRRYKTIEKLNDAWGTWFWGARYDSFEQIGWPSDAPNPSFALDARRFFSQVDVDHQAKQIEILRKLAPTKSITHNFMGLFSKVEYYDLAAPLDYVSWDNYPGSGTAGKIGNVALASAVTWSLKRRNFLVMEQQSGPGGWDCFWNTSPPGEMSMLAWQQVARGADGISYFRWRTSVSGQEQYWHGILNHDGRPRRRYHEVAATGKAMADMSRHILGTEPVATVGILNNYEQIWATDIQRQSGGDPVAFGAIMNDFAQSLATMGVDFGVFREADDLKQYKLLLCPPLYLGDEKFARKLAAYARAGGCVVLTARSGVKDLNNRCVYDPLPGPFAELAGVEVDEYDSLPKDSGAMIELQTGVKIAGARMRERLLPAPGTEVIALHRVGYMDGWAAATRRTLGKGSVIYVGSIPHAEAWGPLLQILLGEVKAPYRLDIPAGVEIAHRRGERKELTFILNHTGELKVIELGDRRFKDLLGGREATGRFELAPYAVAILDARF